MRKKNNAASPVGDFYFMAPLRTQQQYSPGFSVFRTKDATPATNGVNLYYFLKLYNICYNYTFICRREAISVVFARHAQGG